MTKEQLDALEKLVHDEKHQDQLDVVREAAFACVTPISFDFLNKIRTVIPDFISYARALQKTLGEIANDDCWHYMAEESGFTVCSRRDIPENTYCAVCKAKKALG